VCKRYWPEASGRRRLPSLDSSRDPLSSEEARQSSSGVSWLGAAVIKSSHFASFCNLNTFRLPMTSQASWQILLLHFQRKPSLGMKVVCFLIVVFSSRQRRRSAPTIFDLHYTLSGPLNLITFSFPMLRNFVGRIDRFFVFTPTY